MTDDLTNTIRNVRPPGAAADGTSSGVSVDAVQPTELELVSTQMLDVMIRADEDAVRLKLQDLDAAANGVLARSVSQPNADFEVIRGDELECALKDQTNGRGPDDDLDLQLVSTQMVQVLIERPDMTPQQISQEMKLMEEAHAAHGYDPYNKT